MDGSGFQASIFHLLTSVICLTGVHLKVDLCPPPPMITPGGSWKSLETQWDSSSKRGITLPFGLPSLCSGSPCVTENSILGLRVCGK